MHYRSKSSHYHKVTAAEAADMKREAALGDMICNQLKDKHPNQKLYTHSPRLVVNPQLDAHARGDDDDSRQIIADLISDDASPFLPDDEMALRQMSGATLKEMRRKYLKRKAANHSHSQDPAFNAMTAGSHGLAGADFHARANERKRMSDEYIRRNPVRRSDNVAPTANRDDPSFAAMNSEGLADALRRGK